jgi:hypothetical protein
MTVSENAARLWAMVAEHAGRRGDRVGVADVCAVAVDATEAFGAGLTVVAMGASRRVVHVTDAVSERVEELQMTYGEGPGLDVLDDRAPILTADLEVDEVRRRWPAFAPAALGVGVAAIHAFPLQVGAVRVGVLSLYDRKPRSLTAQQLRDVLVLVDTALLVMIGTQANGRNDHLAGQLPDAMPTGLDGYRAEVDQASGMLSVQLGVSIEEALVRLRAYAFAHDYRLADVARDVLARRLRLARDQPGSDRRAPPHDGGAT